MSESRLSPLALWLTQQMERNGWGLRATERETGVSKTAIRNILDNRAMTPELETLKRLSLAFHTPLWRLVEMAGFDLGLPQSEDERARRLLALFKNNPSYRPIVDHMLALDPNDIDGILVYLEGLEARRNRLSVGRQGSDPLGSSDRASGK